MKANNMMQQVLQAMMPVGYVFQWAPVDGVALDLSTAEKVRAYFGFGTWEEVNTFLLGASDDHPAGETGGEEEHTLTVNEMPKHKHGADFIGSDTNVAGKNSGFYTYASSSKWMSTAIYQSAGGDQPHNNMPPYTAVYIWKRIA